MSTTAPSSRTPTRLVVVARVLLVGYLAALAVAVLSPSSDQQDSLLLSLAERLAVVGVPWRLLEFGLLEQLANVAIVVPVGVLGALSFPRLRWQDWAAYVFVGAVAVEVAQGLLLPEREMSATDVVANTLGALLGALLITLIRPRERSDRV